MKKKVGRPSKLSDKVIAQVELLAGMEHTEQEIAQILGVTALTINNWKTNKEFLYALKRGKALTDSKITKTLVKRALGYSYKEITREPFEEIEYEEGQRVSCRKNPNKMIVTKIVEKRIPPNIVAMIFWLKNRRKDLWRDVTSTDINVKGKIIQELHDLAKNGKLKDPNRIANLLPNE